MTLICPECQVEMRPKQCGVAVESMAAFGPYQLYMGDLQACPSCGKEIIAGLPSLPLVQHFEPRYAGYLEKQRQRGTVYRYWKNEREKGEFEVLQEADASQSSH